MYRRPAAAPGTGPKLSEEELKRKSDALFAEFLSTLDKAEALTCVRELNAPAFMPLLVETGLTSMMNAMKDKVSAQPALCTRSWYCCREMCRNLNYPLTVACVMFYF